jgi:NitT/TauT family transport system substrate-binding protein
MQKHLERRTILKGVAALPLFAITGRAAQAAPLVGQEILGAPNGATVILADLIASGGLEKVAPGATFRLWRTTDDLRAGIVSGRNSLFSTPTHVPANLVNRGLPLKMAAIIGMGHLSVITADDKIETFHDLAGKTIMGFFRHDMPDLVFRAIARMEGMDPDKDMVLHYVQTPMEAAQLLVAGKVDTAVLSEPPATAAMMMAAQQGRPLRRAFGLPKLWGDHKGKARIPMVGIALHARLIDEAPDLVKTLGTGLAAARDHVLADRKAAAQLAEKTMEMKPAVFEKAFDHFHIALSSAREVKAELVDFYQTLLDLEPEALGGKLPPDDFYLDL